MIGSIILVLAVALRAASAQTGCDTKADVTFLLDSSDNVGSANFHKQLNFVKDVVNKMQIAPNKTQASIVTFNTGVHNKFFLNRYRDKATMQNAITNIPFTGGLVHTADAIRYATSTSFSPVHGGRNGVPHIAIVLTNAPSGHIDRVKLEAQTARSNGVILYSIGVGAGVDMNELRAIASDPDTRHLFMSQNFDALPSLADLLATKVCNELPPDPSLIPAPTSCLNYSDVVFTVDSSSSVGSTNFQKLEHFLKDIVTKIHVAPNGVQVGMVKYGSYPSVEFPLGAYMTRPEVMKAVESMTYLGGGTNDADAITYTSQQLFSQNNGARGGVPRINVLITDGGSANSAAAVAAANRARTNNIAMMAVGVGGLVDHAEINNIADKPSSSNTFFVNSYDNLDSITDRLINQMCTVRNMQQSLTTAAPGGSLPPDTCRDKLTNCAQYGHESCKNYRVWAHDNCARFCGICTPLYTVAPPKCEDKSPTCNSYGHDYCARSLSWAQTNCQLYCGLCGNGTSPTGYYGQCSYKGKMYNTGQSWQDGCDYECICEDGSTGKYKCHNRCPVYYNLPTDCTVVTQPGQCCLQPVCNFNPTINTHQSSGHGLTTTGIDVCVFKGKQYFERQTWRDGCDFQCHCTDAKKGLYTCDDLCPTYNSIPPYCHLEQQAGDCCSKPVCEFDSQTGSFQGTGTISGSGVGVEPTAHPPCIDVISTCHDYGPTVCTSFQGWASANCRKYCNLCPNGLPKPGVNDKCIFQGTVYSQGDSWNATCGTVCTCENAIYGYYRCADTCPTYNNIPNGCVVAKKAGDCCSTIQCNSGYFLSTSPNVNSIGNGGMFNVSHPPAGMIQVAPTLPSGGTPRPGSGGTGFQAPTLSGCLYKGQLYVQSQAWEDGCDYSCVCTNAPTGLYTCRQKCPTYPALAPSCTLVTDANDVCCKSPKCTKDPVTQQIPVPIPVLRPAIHSHGSVQPPQTHTGMGMYTQTVYLVQTGLTPAPPTPGAHGSGGIGHCDYHGQRYVQDQVWEDGCDFNCICSDASIGHYQCTEKCVHYGALPPQCYLVKDPVNRCCDIPKCSFPVNFITHIGEQVTTPRPVGAYCVYKGQHYQQGQSWYDGCSYQCTCEDSTNNIYRCLSRCPQYNNVDPSCKFVPDPQDPRCCEMPQCPGTGTTTNFTGTGGYQIPSPAPTGSFSGQGTATGFCEYKSIHYTQGQSWQDGCDLNCVCSDAVTGLYRCSEICPRYVNLPTYCTLITDFANPCCKTPRCNFPSNTGGVTGAATPMPGPTHAPTPAPPGATPIPGSTPAPHYKFCVYKGAQYNQGQTWQDGCQYKCRCDDADRGLYVCGERCVTYNNLPAGCTMVADPGDSCCLVPQCNPYMTPSPRPGVSTVSPGIRIPTAPPGEVTGSANIPTPKANQTPQPINYCEYKGLQYSLGQKWDDGCEFTCECLDASIGRYKCIEKCSKFVNLPSSCRLARDPAHPCCQIPECTGQTPVPFGPNPTPGLFSPTPAPSVISNVCVYKGQSYTQGQTWYDGCDYMCDCEDALRGLYRCNNRCPQFTQQLPAQCHMVQSTQDPLCCKEPKCTLVPTRNQTSGYVPIATRPPGVIDGGVATPVPIPTPRPSPGGPTPSPATARPSVCVYKGNQYQQGQKWNDACNYNCECLDALRGRYRCTEMCAKYDDVPNGCRLIRDYNNPCCQTMYCDVNKIPTPAPPGVSTPSPAPLSKSGCMYNGVLFKQDQQWNDGCDLQCICEDQTTGFYTCGDRCFQYDAPAGCTMVTDPRDSCCKVPSCVAVHPSPTPRWVPGMIPTPAPGFTYAPDKIPTPAPGLTYAPGKYPTWVPGMVPTPAPGSTYAPDKIPTPGPFRTYAPGKYPTWVPGMVPTPAPGSTFAPNRIPTPGPGRTYAPGMYPIWVPGMKPTPAPGYTFPPYLVPTPRPGQTYAPGQFPVPTTKRYPTPVPGHTFPTWHPGMVPTPAPGFTYPPYLIPTPAPGSTYAPGKFPTWVPGMRPTLAPGITLPPWLVPTPAPHSTYAPFHFPPWVPGMIPTPAPGSTFAPNKIPTPSYGKTYPPGLYPTWVPGMVPTPAPGSTFAPGKVPTPAPHSTYAPGMFPTWVPGMIPTPAPGLTFAPNKIPTPAPGQTYAPLKFPTWVPGMVPTPAPGYTFAPNKIPTPGPFRTYAPGKFPTWVPGMIPTPAPHSTYAPNMVPTPGQYRTYAPGMYPTWVPGMVPTPAPGSTFAPDKIPTPGPSMTYAPGKYPTWVPGMIPTPAPGSTFAPDKIPTPGPGRTYKPGMYPTWVPGMVPTPAPGSTYAPDKIPTPGPFRTYAPGKYPTWVPGMVPTPAPGSTFAPNRIPTPGPGRTYAPGMYPIWVPGMKPTPAPGYTFPPYLVPTPRPGQTYAPGQFPVPTTKRYPTPVPGHTFPTWHPGMVPTPAPGFTYPPYLIPTPAPGSTYAPGKFPTWVPGMRPTLAPGITLPPWLVPTPAPHSTYAPFHFPPWVPGMIPTPAPGSTFAPNKIPTPSYGKTYPPGLYPTWVPGMVPTPAPGSTFAPGKVPTPAPHSTYAPGMFPTWVPGMIPTPAPGLTFAPNKIPTPAPGQTYAPLKFPTWVPGMVPTPAPGYTFAPDKIPTPGPFRTYAPGKFPTWVPGMIPTPAPGFTFAPNKIPTPGPGRTYKPGMYPTWVPGMEPTPAPGSTYAPNKLPTPGPSRTYAPGMFPTPTPAVTPYAIPTAIPGYIHGTGVNSNQSACVHHGIAYKQGQTWQDGCRYDCECLDDHTGRYQCKERCPLYLNIPSNCRLVVDPNDACCKVPICDTAPPPTVPTQFHVPTVRPSGGSNPPPVVPTTRPPQPKSEVCIMDGKQYVAGQTWYKDCDQQCVCEDGKTGFYRCYDRCVEYKNIPSSCTLVADPNDPTCCKVPQCIPIPGSGFTNPTGQPFTVTGVTGIVTGRLPITPAPTPGVFGSTPAPRNVCIYYGRAYHPGQKWQDACKYECICEDGATGRYTCKQRCAVFPFVPPYCTMKRDPKDICCYVPVCDSNQKVPTLAPPLTGPTPSPGVSTQVPPQTPPTLPPSFCVYKGVAYRHGQTWDDGCTKKCRCDDADQNIYTCFDRCASFTQLAGCVMVSDPADSCCQIPKCTYIPTPGPTLRPPVSGGPTPSPNPYPSPLPTAPTGVISGGPEPNPITGVAPKNIGYCVYKGVHYMKGQTWNDSCTYVCSCVDDMTGRYQCTEKCPRYVQIPSYCRMVQDPNNRCCRKPYCPGLTPTIAPTQRPGVSTPVPTPFVVPPQTGVCIMGGKSYTTGQKWYDDCNQICICADGKTGAYSCTERCPVYTQQAGCIMVPDPRDPVCCQAPQCGNVTGVSGTITGYGTPPTPTLRPSGASPTPSPTGPTSAPTPKPKVCVYMGKSYLQGQQWQDGCQYDCICEDGITGRYRCRDRCPRYPNLPATCRLVYDPSDPCCKKPDCSAVPTPHPPNVSTLTPPLHPSTAPAPEFCVYQGVAFRQGQTFNQGCEKICKCEDASTDVITCSERCATYPASSLKQGCTLVTDPRDQCCQIPSCVNPNTPDPQQVVTGVLGTITGSNLPGNTNPYTGTGGTRNVCVYNGKMYQQGQTWNDSCSYTCECIDTLTGRYRCTEKCPRYPGLPSYCTLTQDPNNVCCQKPYCTPGQLKTPTPGPLGASTPVPPPTTRNVCVYNGNMYQQGQQWYDGCNAICRCEDSSRNFHRCQERCATYTNVGQGCKLVADPKDPTCCEIPECPIIPPSGPSPTPGIISIPGIPGGVITGYGPVPQVTPSPIPGQPTPSPLPKSGCMYKGMVFNKGQKFDDGCDYECECLDDHTGHYQCVQKCQRYAPMPSRCVLVQDINKPCCQVPYCDFTNPTPFPNGIPTPRPGITPSPGVVTVAPYIIPDVIPTPRPQINLTPTPGGTTPTQTARPTGFCVYKGVYYMQGQTWDDGCNSHCRCEDVIRGYYTCSQRCPSYNNLPAACVLRTDPADACCLVPDCNGNIPTPGTTRVPPVGQTNPPAVITPLPISGSFTGTSGGNPVVVPYTPGSGTSGSASACVYKGSIYTQGQTWQDGCSYNCECIDSNRGMYRCNDRCQKYPYLPPQCYYKPSPTDTCCRVAVCNTLTSQTTPQPRTVAPYTVVTVPLSGKCVYKNGVQYAAGATWQDGCQTSCTCSNPATNTYTCSQRCPVFSSLPSICHLVTDPSDRCCMKLNCTTTGGITLTPYIGTGTSGTGPPPTSLHVLPVGTHQVITGYGTGPSGSGQNRCIYKGSTYTQGQSWDDGCDYVCTCEDSSSGMYRCTSKCPHFPPLPGYCHSVAVPGQCCHSISCDIAGYGTYTPVPQLVPTPGPSVPSTGTTSNPQIINVPPVTGNANQCVYKTNSYNQGATWDDGCDYHCQCLDSRSGYFECKPLCPTYNNLPSQQCYMVKANGQCCSQPMCYDQNKNQSVNPITTTGSVFPVVGTYAGGFTGFRPDYTFPMSGSRHACVYKGVVHTQGQTWDDGCDFSCTCVDQSKGLYKCTAKCPTYTVIPPLCQLVSQSGSCCKKLTCNPSAVTRPVGPTPTPSNTTQRPTSNCKDKIPNCRDYGRQACGSFAAWAGRNCPLFCGNCTPTFTTPAPTCEDKLPNCPTFGKSTCSGIYRPWARDNCRKYCGLCPNVGTTHPTPASSNQCVDVATNCAILGPYYCKGEFLSFALSNCMQTCNLCNVTTTPTAGVATTGWQLLLKGVSGAAGPDLWPLWRSNQTLNPNVNMATHLTSEFNGHYKPDLSNNWNTLCLDQIKVSIYKNGIEKANIVFNATGADKNSWFTSDRIISSTWTDIKTATKDHFSLTGDVSMGRQFYVSGHTSTSDHCDSYGWLMVSTKSTCFFERGDRKPTFYYAPGTSQAHWGFTNPGKGDVFAIQGHSDPNCRPPQLPPNHTNPPQVCKYKGSTYTQGQHWNDSCNFHCTCEDASTGYYRCKTLCPVYTRLPAGCQLVTKPGECCAEPNCPGIIVVTKKPDSFVGGTPFCTYGTDYYTQGQKWKVGCSQLCECTDADTGGYSCHGVCLTWRNLPSTCHLDDPPPGLCCKQPACPAGSGFIIQVRVAFKDQYPVTTNHNYVYV